MSLQNFVDKVGPTVSALWLNAVDILKETIFENPTTKAQARTNLTNDAPLEVVNGGTGQRTLAAFAQDVLPYVYALDVRNFGAVGDGFTDDTPAIQAAIAAATAAQGGRIYFPAGSYLVKSGFTASYNGTVFWGEGWASKILVDFDGDVFTFPAGASLCEIHNLEFIIQVARTASLIACTGGSQGWVDNVRFTGKAGVNNGKGITISVESSDNWRFSNVRATGGVTWDYLIKVGPVPGFTVAETHLHNWITANNNTYTEAAVVADTGVDTLEVLQYCGGPILCKNSLGGQAPRWVRFVNSFVEADPDAGVLPWENIAIDLQAVRDFRYENGYVASCETALSVGANCRNVSFHNNIVVQTAKQAVKIANGAIDTRISHNSFDGTCEDTDNTYPTVEVAAGTDQFHIDHNTFLDGATNKPNYNVYIAAGASSQFSVDQNDFGSPVTGYVFNGSTSQHHSMQGNTPLSANKLIDSINAFTDGDTSPSVAVGTHFAAANTGSTTITNFDDGVNNQTIFVRLDVNTGITHDANKIRLKGSASIGVGTATSDNIISFYRISGIWFEQGRNF